MNQKSPPNADRLGAVIVGKKMPPSHREGIRDQRFFILKYEDVPTDLNDWVDATQFLPADCDLVMVQIENRKPFPGWYTCGEWHGARLKKTDKVLYWRLERERMDVTNF